MDRVGFFLKDFWENIGIDEYKRENLRFDGRI